jgi:hypothetical protein
MKFIAYIDLLGIKDMAKYSVVKYTDVIHTFTAALSNCQCCSDSNKSYNKNKVYYFSDSALMYYEKIEDLFDYLIRLRTKLFINDPPIVFTAAIGINSKDTIPIKVQNRKCVAGISFSDENACNVYILQNNFKGIGIFISNDAFNTCSEETKEKYISESFYFPTITTQGPVCYHDLKFPYTDLAYTTVFDAILKRYHSADLKNRKYGRFYLSFFANWIKSDISYHRDDGDFTYYSYIIAKNSYIIDRLRKHAYKFDNLIFFILNDLFNLIRDDSNAPNVRDKITEVMNFITSESSIKKCSNDISQIPDTILSDTNREDFICSLQEIGEGKQRERNTNKNGGAK